jgi:hypothetical protein
MNIPGLTLIRELSWNDVFEFWRENEEHRENWTKLWKERGFASWADWRKTYADGLGLPSKSWKLYRVDDASISIPDFHGGPFRGWTERFYNGASAPAFKEIVKHPDIRSHTGILDIKKHFPVPTTITGVQNDDGIVITEGMHRCAAIALAAADGQNIATELYIALSDKEPGHLPLIGKRD